MLCYIIKINMLHDSMRWWFFTLNLAMPRNLLSILSMALLFACFSTIHQGTYQQPILNTVQRLVRTENRKEKIIPIGLAMPENNVP